MPSRPTHKTHTDVTYQTTSTLAPQSSHTHRQDKPIVMYHANSNNQMTKTTTHNNTTQPPQHSSQNIYHKRNQTCYRSHHKHNQTDTIKPQYTTTSILDIATASHPIPQLFHKEIKPATMDLLMQRGNQSRQNLSFSAPLPLLAVHHRFI